MDFTADMLLTVTRAYLATALWLESTDETGETKLDQHFEVSGLPVGVLAAACADVMAFIVGCVEERPEIFAGMELGQIGHDFWLTRNGHGAGFWDRGLGERGDWLSAMAKPYGEASLTAYCPCASKCDVSCTVEYSG